MEGSIQVREWALDPKNNPQVKLDDALKTTMTHNWCMLNVDILVLLELQTPKSTSQIYKNSSIENIMEMSVDCKCKTIP